MGSHRVDGRILFVRSGARRDSIIEQIRASAMESEAKPPDLLIDARALENAPHQLSTDLVHDRALEIAARGFQRCAVLAANVPLQRALAAYFAAAAKAAGMDARVFLTMEDAAGWLGYAVEVRDP